MKRMIKQRDRYQDQAANQVPITYNTSLTNGPTDNMTDMTEMTRLSLKAKAGDRVAEEMLFEKLLVRFSFIARRRVWREIAEDLAQDACRKVFEKYKTEKITSSFDSWAYKILRNTIGNHIQREKVRKNILVSNNDWERMDESVSTEVDEDLTRNLLDSLKKITSVNRRYARILVLIYQGYKINEICDKLQISPNYCYVILNRARNMLRRCLESGNI